MPGHKLPFVTFGNSDKLRVADWVLAIGNPFGLPGSTSAGIVSAMNRDINEGAYDDFIQTDAAINRGNSGGPLFNLQGQVIGVDSAIYSPSGGSIGIGFAIPSAMAMPVAYELKDTGSMTRGWLGVDTQEVTTQIQQLLGLPNSSGALVGGIAGNGPAAGKLQAGDVLVSLAGVPVANPRALLIRTAEIPAGQSVVAQFWRDGHERQATITVTVPPAQTDNTLRSASAPPPAVDVAVPRPHGGGTADPGRRLDHRGHGRRPGGESRHRRRRCHRTGLRPDHRHSHHAAATAESAGCGGYEGGNPAGERRCRRRQRPGSTLGAGDAAEVRKKEVAAF